LASLFEVFFELFCEILMKALNYAIGVFDSGMGGLTVLAALRRVLPHENFIYLGDTARLPYGTKSQTTVQQYSMQMTKFLLQYNIKALVIACNTATTAALPLIQSTFPSIPVIGVVRPGAAAAVMESKNKNIAVIATERTVASAAYQTEINRLEPHAKVYTKSCGLLVAIAEEGLMHHTIAYDALSYYLADLSDEDTILLGCTHFPVFKETLVKVLGTGIKIVDSAHATAEVLLQELKNKKLLNVNPELGLVQYLVTDSIERFEHIGAIFLQTPLDRKDIVLIDVNMGG
jgi:glutamate racemase